MKETFRNNYGIIVSKQEWNKRGCDGSITRVFKDGTTTLEVYAQGALHGEVTRTFPHSTTLAVIETYDQGRLLSKKTFFPNALPAKEEVYHEDGSFSLTRWPDNNNSDTITDPCFVEKLMGEEYWKVITPLLMENTLQQSLTAREFALLFLRIVSC